MLAHKITLDTCTIIAFLALLPKLSMVLTNVIHTQMVGLYKDPDGNDITFMTSTQNDYASADVNRNDGEIRELRRRINELENSLLQCVSDRYSAS